MIDPRTLAPLDMRHDPEVGREDGPARRRRPVDAARLGRRRHRGGGRVGGLRLAQGAGQARDRARRDRPVQRADGGVPPAERGEDRRSGAAGARQRARSGVVMRAADGGRLGLLRAMWRIRVFEERVGALTRANEVHGLVHLSVGQEGVAVGVCGALRDDDAVYCNHRAHGHAIAKGAPLDGVLAELMGREGGLCRGMGGSMHLVDVEHGFLGATGVVGGNVPLALGSALALRARRRRRGRRRLLRRRRRPERHLRRVGQPRDALEAAGDPRVREQRLRGVHAALGAHERRARERRRLAVRPRARDGGRQRRRRRARRRSSASSPRRARAKGRSCSSASRIACAATTRATRSTTGRRSPPRSGRSSTRSCACSGGSESRASELEAEARAEVDAAERVARESPFPPPSLTAELVYA